VLQCSQWIVRFGRWAVAFAVLVGGLLTASPVRACSMVEFPLEARLAAAAIVVHGVVRSVEPNRAELAVQTAFRGHRGPTIEVENRHIGFHSDCAVALWDDGRFAVGDELLLFLDVPEDGSPIRPIGAFGDGAFVRTRSGFAWVGVSNALFDPDALFAFAGNEGDLFSATRSRKARQFVDPPVAPPLEPPPVTPRASGGCTTGERSRANEICLVALALLAGLRTRSRVKR
jgi:hypothetical protein